MRAPLLLAFLASLAAVPALAQGRAPPPETMDIGDEPGASPPPRR